jgi:hypothetical protein
LSWARPVVIQLPGSSLLAYKYDIFQYVRLDIGAPFRVSSISSRKMTHCSSLKTFKPQESIIHAVQP